MFATGRQHEWRLAVLIMQIDLNLILHAYNKTDDTQEQLNYNHFAACKLLWAGLNVLKDCSCRAVTEEPNVVG